MSEFDDASQGNPARDERAGAIEGMGNGCGAGREQGVGRFWGAHYRRGSYQSGGDTSY